MPKSPKLQLRDGESYRFSGCDDVSRRIVTRFAEVMGLEFQNPKPGEKAVSVFTGHPWLKMPHGTDRVLRPSVIDPCGNGTLLALQFARIASVVARDAGCGGGLLLHGALAERDGYGVLLAGPGGVGKTTAVRRLRSSWRMLCDDTTLVVRVPGGGYWAHPWPTWSRFMFGDSGGSWDVQYSVPLRAVFFLAQAETDRTEPVGVGKAVSLLVESAAQVSTAVFGSLDDAAVRAHRLRRFDNAHNLARALSCFELRLSLTGAYWEEMEKVFQGAAIPASPIFS